MQGPVFVYFSQKLLILSNRVVESTWYLNKHHRYCKVKCSPTTWAVVQRGTIRVSNLTLNNDSAFLQIVWSLSTKGYYFTFSDLFIPLWADSALSPLKSLQRCILSFASLSMFRHPRLPLPFIMPCCASSSYLPLPTRWSAYSHTFKYFPLFDCGCLPYCLKVINGDPLRLFYKAVGLVYHCFFFNRYYAGKSNKWQQESSHVSNQVSHVFNDEWTWVRIQLSGQKEPQPQKKIYIDD